MDHELTHHLFFRPEDWGREQFSWFSQLMRRPDAVISGHKFALPFGFGLAYGPAADRMADIYKTFDENDGFFPRQTIEELSGYLKGMRQPMREALRDYRTRPYLWDAAAWFSGIPQLCVFYHLGSGLAIDPHYRVDAETLDDVKSSLVDEFRGVKGDRAHADLEGGNNDFFVKDSGQFLRVLERFVKRIKKDFPDRFSEAGQPEAAVFQGVGVIQPEELVSEEDVAAVVEAKIAVFEALSEPGPPESREGVSSGDEVGEAQSEVITNSLRRLGGALEEYGGALVVCLKRYDKG